MCESCEADETSAIGRRRLPERVIACARVIEGDSPGARVSEDDWQIFAGTKGGALSWESFMRLAQAHEAANVVLSMHRAD